MKHDLITNTEINRQSVTSEVRTILSYMSMNSSVMENRHQQMRNIQQIQGMLKLKAHNQTRFFDKLRQGLCFR